MTRLEIVSKANPNIPKENIINHFCPFEQLYFKRLNYNQVNNVSKIFKDFGCQYKEELDGNEKQKYCVPCWNEEYDKESETGIKSEGNSNEL